MRAARPSRLRIERDSVSVELSGFGEYRVPMTSLSCLSWCKRRCDGNAAEIELIPVTAAYTLREMTYRRKRHGAARRKSAMDAPLRYPISNQVPTAVLSIRSGISHSLNPARDSATRAGKSCLKS